MGFYDDVRATYGGEVVQRMKQWSNNLRRLAARRNRRIFLHECKRRSLIPTHIKNSIKSVDGLFEFGNMQNNRKLRDFNDNLMRKILNLEIRHTVVAITQIEKQNMCIFGTLKQTLPVFILNEFKLRQYKSYNNYFRQVKEKNVNKLNSLSNSQIASYNIQDEWFKNLSSKIIPNDVQTMLALGPRFSLHVPVREISVDNLIADIEHILDSVPERNRDFYRAKLSSIMTSYIHRYQDSSHNTDYMYQNTKYFLKNNSDLIITTSDKGGVTVAMDATAYSSKVDDILRSDSFRQLNSDPTLTLQNKANKYIARLNNLDIIDDVTAKKMKKYNSVPPKLYGNPKVHKEGNPLRPIVSSVNGPINNLAKYLADILSSAYNKENDYYIKDSFHFAEQLNGFVLPCDYVVASLDVVNLFGNLSKELITTVIIENWPEICRKTNVSKELFLELLHFVLDNNYFMAGTGFYLQTFGCAMGSHLSPIVSQYVMDYVLDMCIHKLSFSFAFIKKFVDDIIVALPEDKIDETLHTLNSFNTHITFTIEREVDHSVPFLDTRVKRQNNIVMLDWYRKASNANKFVHFLSNHSINVKINFIKEMKNRIEKICHPTFLKKNMDKVRQLLIKNSYPASMVVKLLYSSIDHRPPRSRDRAEPIDQSTVGYGVIPNIRGLTNKIINVFKDKPIKIAVKNVKTVGNLYTRLKTKTPTSLRSNVIYKLNCRDCSQSYVGQTSQWLKSRISLHKSDITKGLTRCALANHANQNRHTVDFDNVQVLATEPLYKKRLVLEMININKQEDPINKKTDTQNLSSVYTYLLTYPNRKSSDYDGPIDE